MNVNEVNALLNGEIAQIREVWLRDKITSLLIPIREQKRTWEWDDRNTAYSIWLVADIRHRNVAIAYSDAGYGLLGKPWGLVFLGDVDGSVTGTDDAWYRTLEDCLRDYGFSEDGNWWEK